MWEIYEHRKAVKKLESLPIDVLKQYDKWKDYREERKRVKVSVGESVRIIRELQELSQNDLSRITVVPQSTISAIENDRVNLGVERAKLLARALKCHPAVPVFPGWEVHQESVA